MRSFNSAIPLLTEIGFARFGITQPIYELAYARYREPLYAAFLSRGERRSDFALWFGVGELPQPQPIRWRSANYPASGYAILARGEGEQATWLCLKYGPHGGGHGHPDKLNFVLYARGQVLALDPGITRYGVPIHGGWYKTTLAHNTLVVDETNQRPAEGKCLSFGAEGGIDFVVADAGDIYDGVRFRRAIALLNENTIVVIDHVRCDKERLLDVALHLRGQWADLPKGEKWTPPEKDGYRYLTEATIRRVSESVAVAVNPRSDRRVAVTLIADAPFDLVTTLGVGSHSADRVPMIMVRRQGKDLALVWCISLDGRLIQAMWTPNAAKRPTDIAVQVKLPDGQRNIIIADIESGNLKVVSGE
jgi:hypothetical protein